jgi:SAM-dependent methyltransferase
VLNEVEVRRRAEELGPWFYEFDLGGGLRTECKLDAAVKNIHETRRGMLEGVLREQFGSRLSEIRALDLGCHEGWFSVFLRDLGIPRVIGVDVRAESLAKARFVTESRGLQGLEFIEADCEELDGRIEGEFDLCLAIGLIYHLENPMRVLRQAARRTREMLVIETQVIDEVAGSTEWGQADARMTYHGALALIDETFAFEGGSPEAGGTPLALCPSVTAVHTMLNAVGFPRTSLVKAPADGNEQLARGKRVLIVGRR